MSVPAGRATGSGAGTPPPPGVLLADDQPEILEALRLLLKGEGYELVAVDSPGKVMAALSERDFDAVLLDLNYSRDTTSGREGLDLVARIRAMDPAIPVVVMTAWGSVDGAVEAMRLGARDYIEKPWDNTRLLATMRTQVELGQALRRSRRLEGENLTLRREGLPEMVARAPSMAPVIRLIERVGPSEANVLITGEHGTGKEVVARWLHAMSGRAPASMITVNAGAIADGIFESELFGHVKGAFTDARTDRDGAFELADRGTLFLDEIGTMPPSHQSKLLRVLQTGEFQKVGSSRTRRVDVRVLSATNVDIAEEIREGRFREDLLFRLNTVEIALPPLRDRREDIPALATHFLERQKRRNRTAVEGFDPEAMAALLGHAWPGNIRELEHCVERSVLLAPGDWITPDDLGLRDPTEPGGRLDELTLEEAERLLIRKALARSDGNVSKAAEALGLSRSALYRRLERYGL